MSSSARTAQTSIPRALPAVCPGHVTRTPTNRPTFTSDQHATTIAGMATPGLWSSSTTYHHQWLSVLPANTPLWLRIPPRPGAAMSGSPPHGPLPKPNEKPPSGISSPWPRPTLAASAVSIGHGWQARRTGNAAVRTGATSSRHPMDNPGSLLFPRQRRGRRNPHLDPKGGVWFN